MANILSVQVLDSDGDPAEGKRVNINVHGVVSGGFLGEEYTDDDGQVEFTTSDDYESWIKITIYVDGDACGEYSIGAGHWTITLE